MKVVWRRVLGVIKDNKSLLKASLTPRSLLLNPDIEAAVIKATTHDELTVDYRNTQCVFAWVRVSGGAHLRPVLWSISHRVGKTCSWVVALKGLMLLHGVFYCNVPAVQNIGRLPFHLSKYFNAKKQRKFGAFIQAYYAFLDQKSSFIFRRSHDQDDGHKYSTIHYVQKLQGLLDMLLHIKPQSHVMVNVVLLEAMGCIVIEIFDIYSRICNGIGSLLVKIYSASRMEAEMILSILQKAMVQSQQLSLYFELCRNMGVINASEFPKVERIREEDIRQVEHIVNGVSEESETQLLLPKEEEKDAQSNTMTVVTDNWEVFEEEGDKKKKKKWDEEFYLISLDSPTPTGKNNVKVDPLIIDELPDLITF